MIGFCSINPLPVDEVADGECGAAPAPGAEHRRHRRLRGEVPLVPAHPERAEGKEHSGTWHHYRNYRLDDGFKRLYLRILEQAQHAFLESKGRGRRRRLASQFTVSYCLNRYEAQKTFQLRCLGKTLKYGRTLERKEFLLKHCFGRQFI